MRRNSLVLLALSTTALAACAPQQRLASTAPPPTWAFEQSDIPVDPAFRFGKLDNGMRYVVRRNATPKGTAQVRMKIDAGSLDETDSERGFAHFVEHMAFNGSTNVPEGEMIKLLERKGLAFGADTNASTGFDQTIYMLDLPRADPALLDTALMLMRETASELKFDPAAVERERGVILAEKRDRNTFAFRNQQDQIAFLHPRARYGKRMPIGVDETLNAASAEALKAFWRREYVPAQTTLIVVGDFDPAMVESEIKARFASWKAVPADAHPDAGPVDPKAMGRTEIYIDPALTERITVSRHGPWLDERDTVAQRRENMLRQIGYAIVNRRMTRLSRLPDPPFRDAGFGTSDVFKTGRTTNLVLYTVDRKWRRGLVAATLEYRKALAQGFTKAEVAEQVAGIRTAARNAAASADTRSHSALVGAVFALINDDITPSTPQSALERLEAFIPEITPERVLEALKREAVPLKDPLIRFEGRNLPEGGEAAIRAAWNEAARARLERSAAAAASTFAYTDFGTPGAVASDTREPLLGIREVVFANGVRLNVKKTDLDKEKVLVQLSVDGGDMLATRDNPLATEMTSMLTNGGLGKHSQDELQSLLAGRTVGANVTSTAETFVSSAQTTPLDLELQLQVMAAFLTDPGFRPEGELRYRLNINNFFAQMRATPGAALNNSVGGILSDNDPRFTLQKPDDYRRLTFAKLKADIADRLAHGAIEIGVVGDVDEDQAIRLVGRTFGALPAREKDFGAYPDQRRRPFTADHTPRTVYHTGPKDQAVIRVTWPSRDDSDPQEKQVLNLLERIVRIELTDNLRERLGKAYSPGSSSQPSAVWRGYGTFEVTASVDVKDVAAVRAAIAETIAELRDKPLDPDIIQRAREPLLESFDNQLKTNFGWMTLVDRAQTEADRIERQVKAGERLQAVTAADIQAAARKYLTAARGVEITVLPEPAAPAKP
ncbi:MAG: insulinase family protein [Novosphingobium sp.]